MIRLTGHAAGRVASKEVTRAWIEAAVVLPDWQKPDPRRPGVTLAFRAIAAFGNRVLRVAYRPDGNDVLVITAFFDRGARR